AASWDADLDPGLDTLGQQQAERMARSLALRGPLDLIASPMARTRETAAPLAQAWKLAPRVEPRVSEIPSPAMDLKARGQWLRDIGTRHRVVLDAELRGRRAVRLAALM